MRDIFDRLLTSTPINNAAGTVTSSASAYQSTKQVAQAHWSAPPKMRAPNVTELANKEFADLKGRRFGQFIVIGILVEGPKNRYKKQMWVVKCVCGDYESRTARSIRNPENAQDRCDYCRQVDYLRSLEKKKALGLIKRDTVEDWRERQCR